MKRSEMIEKVHDFFEYWMGFTLTDDTAKRLIIMLELEGMLPPKHPRKTMSHVLKREHLYAWEDEE